MSRRRCRSAIAERRHAHWRELCETGLEPFVDRQAAELALVSLRARRALSGPSNNPPPTARHCLYCPRWHHYETQPPRERHTS